jgi:hypothetical protein
MARILQTINAGAGEHQLPETVLNDTFEKWWPDLEKDISTARTARPPAKPAHKRDTRELLDEILSLVRSVAQDQKTSVEVLAGWIGELNATMNQRTFVPPPGAVLTLAEANPSGRIPTADEIRSLGASPSSPFSTDQSPRSMIPSRSGKPKS